MLIRDIKNYLCDNNFNINIYEKKLYINNYDSIEHISDKMLVIRFKEFNLKVIGKDFVVLKMFSNEVLFSGKIESVAFLYK